MDSSGENDARKTIQNNNCGYIGSSVDGPAQKQNISNSAVFEKHSVRNQMGDGLAVVEDMKAHKSVSFHMKEVENISRQRSTERKTSHRRVQSSSPVGLNDMSEPVTQVKNRVDGMGENPEGMNTSIDSIRATISAIKENALRGIDSFDKHEVKKPIEINESRLAGAGNHQPRLDVQRILRESTSLTTQYRPQANNTAELRANLEKLGREIGALTPSTKLPVHSTAISSELKGKETKVEEMRKAMETKFGDSYRRWAFTNAYSNLSQNNDTGGTNTSSTEIPLKQQGSSVDSDHLGSGSLSYRNSSTGFNYRSSITDFGLRHYTSSKRPYTTMGDSFNPSSYSKPGNSSTTNFNDLNFTYDSKTPSTSSNLGLSTLGAGAANSYSLFSGSSFFAKERERLMRLDTMIHSSSIPTYSNRQGYEYKPAIGSSTSSSVGLTDKKIYSETGFRSPRDKNIPKTPSNPTVGSFSSSVDPDYFDFLNHENESTNNQSVAGKTKKLQKKISTKEFSNSSNNKKLVKKNTLTKGQQNNRIMVTESKNTRKIVSKTDTKKPLKCAYKGMVHKQAGQNQIHYVQENLDGYNSIIEQERNDKKISGLECMPPNYNSTCSGVPQDDNSESEPTSISGQWKSVAGQNFNSSKAIEKLEEVEFLPHNEHNVATQSSFKSKSGIKYKPYTPTHITGNMETIDLAGWEKQIENNMSSVKDAKNKLLQKEVNKFASSEQTTNTAKPQTGLTSARRLSGRPKSSKPSVYSGTNIAMLKRKIDNINSSHKKYIDTLKSDSMNFKSLSKTVLLGKEKETKMAPTKLKKKPQRTTKRGTIKIKI